MKRAPHPTAAKGFVLIEVMVALLIFMLGVLGMVGLQAALTRSASDSKIRADASYLASEMVGRLWSDVKNVSTYSSCTSVALCKEWQSKVAASLPNGAGAVSVTMNGSDAAVTITISWTGPDQQTHQYATSTNIVPNS